MTNTNKKYAVTFGKNGSLDSIFFDTKKEANAASGSLKRSPDLKGMTVYIEKRLSNGVDYAKI
jgi:hypothetical protein